MTLDNIDDMHSRCLYKLVDYLFDEVMSAGGDGDAWLIISPDDYDECIQIAKKLNEIFKWPYNVREISELETIFSQGQEALTITKDPNYEIPIWAQCVVYLTSFMDTNFNRLKYLESENRRLELQVKNLKELNNGK